MKCRKRGPDNTVSRVIENNPGDFNVYLLFHRLKINDKIIGTNLLIHPDDCNLILICNGEIYNWKTLFNENRFKTQK